jgi:hypothetical protein
MAFWPGAGPKRTRDGRLAELVLTPPGADSQQACPPSHARDQKATPVQEAVHLNEVADCIFTGATRAGSKDGWKVA